ncbi:MAG TPA: spore cortex biosynthesis protein YabQ [Bacillota bacterium]|nr:spore cortex biosynthesis protein YabQ [Bacillota bacterium]
MPSTVNQAYVFLATVYSGFIIGFIYDIFRMIRHIIKPGRLATAILDLVFWIIIAGVSFLVVFNVNYGEVRVYTIAGLIIGWSLYAMILSPIIFKVLTGICKAVSFVFKWVVWTISWPFKFFASLLKYPTGLLKSCGLALLSKTKAITRKLYTKKDLKKIPVDRT